MKWNSFISIEYRCWSQCKWNAAELSFFRILLACRSWAQYVSISGDEFRMRNIKSTWNYYTHWHQHRHWTERQRKKKTLFHFQSFVHNVVQFVSTNALIGKIQDINKYVLCKQSFVGVSVQWACTTSKSMFMVCDERKNCVKMGESFAGYS